MENRYDYYYGKDAEQFRYYQIPKELLDNPEFSSLSLDSKLLYAVLRDHMQLSRANSWIDENQRIYIIFSIETISQKLGVCPEKAIRLLKELENFGLVEKKRRGQGMNSLLYIKNFTSNNQPDKEEDPLSDSNNQPEECLEETCSTDSTPTILSTTSEFGKTEFKKSEKPNLMILKRLILIKMILTGVFIHSITLLAPITNASICWVQDFKKLSKNVF